MQVRAGTPPHYGCSMHADCAHVNKHACICTNGAQTAPSSTLRWRWVACALCLVLMSIHLCFVWNWGTCGSCATSAPTTRYAQHMPSRLYVP